MPLDTASQKILRLLQQEGRITVQELAEQVGLSTSPCWRRLKELEKEGFIHSYAALLDRHKLGLDLCMIVQVTLARHEEGVVDAFEEHIKACKEVVECYEMTGDADYWLKILLPNIEAYNHFLHEQLLRIAGVSQLRSSVALKEIKYETALPV